MKMIIIAVVLLLLLGGGGAGAYFYFMQEQPELTQEEKEELAKKEAKEAEKLRQIVEFPEMIVPILSNDGVSQSFTVVIALEVVNAEAATKVNEMTPKLRSIFIRDIYAQLNQHAAVQGGVIQLAKIKKSLKKAANKELKDDLVYEVLLQVAQQKPV